MLWGKLYFGALKKSPLINAPLFQCKLARDSNPMEQRELSKKPRASRLFKATLHIPQNLNSHSSLAHSSQDNYCGVPIPFKAGRLNLHSDERWTKIMAQTHEQRIDNHSTRKMGRCGGGGGGGRTAEHSLHPIYHTMHRHLQCATSHFRNSL